MLALRENTVAGGTSVALYLWENPHQSSQKGGRWQLPPARCTFQAPRWYGRWYASYLSTWFWMMKLLLTICPSNWNLIPCLGCLIQANEGQIEQQCNTRQTLVPRSTDRQTLNPLFLAPHLRMTACRRQQARNRVHNLIEYVSTRYYLSSGTHY